MRIFRFEGKQKPEPEQKEEKKQAQQADEVEQRDAIPHNDAEVKAFLENYKKDDDETQRAVQAMKNEREAAEEEKNRKRRRKTYMIVAIVSLCAIGLILWLAIPHSGSSPYENNASGIVQEGLEVHEGFPVSINGTSVAGGNFYVIDGQVGYVSDTSIVRLSEHANPVYERSHSFYHPITQVSGEYLLVYNVGSNGFRIDNQKETIRNETLDYIIMAADVAENGKYALVTEMKGYPSHMEVFQEDGSVQYRYSFSNCYVADVSLSSDGNRAAVIGVTATEGELVSELYFFDFNDETPLAIVQYPGTMLLDVEFCSDGRALAIGDNLVTSVSNDGEKIDYPYGDLRLADFDFNNNRALLALSPYDSTSASKLLVFNSKGEEAAVRDCQEVMSSVSLYGDTMAALSGSNVYSYSVNAVRNFRGEEGEQQAAFHVTETSNDAKAIALADESSVYILGISEVSFEDY